MAKKKKNSKVTNSEIKTVEGVAGAKAGLAMAARMEMLKSPYMFVPITMGSAAAMLLPGEETNNKVENAIKMVKEAEMGKAEIVFQKLSKCKKKKKMTKTASPVGMAAFMALSMAPKPRTTATTVVNPNTGKNVEMKKLVNLPKK